MRSLLKSLVFTFGIFCLVLQTHTAFGEHKGFDALQAEVQQIENELDPKMKVAQNLMDAFLGDGLMVFLEEQSELRSGRVFPHHIHRTQQSEDAQSTQPEVLSSTTSTSTTTTTTTTNLLALKKEAGVGNPMDNKSRDKLKKKKKHPGDSKCDSFPTNPKCIPNPGNDEERDDLLSPNPPNYNNLNNNMDNSNSHSNNRNLILAFQVQNGLALLARDAKLRGAIQHYHHHHQQQQQQQQQNNDQQQAQRIRHQPLLFGKSRKF